MSNKLVGSEGVGFVFDKVKATIQPEGRTLLAEFGIEVPEGVTEVELIHQITLTGMGTLGPLVLTKLLPRIKTLLEEHGQEMALVGQSNGAEH